MILILVTVILGLFAHNDKPATIVFAARPITIETVKDAGKSFPKGEKVYYYLASKKKIKDEYIRIQIMKKDEKSEFWGYSIASTQDEYIGKNKRYFTDYFVIHDKGYYIMQIFPFKNLDEPIAREDFWIYDN